MLPRATAEQGHGSPLTARTLQLDPVSEINCLVFQEVTQHRQGLLPSPTSTHHAELPLQSNHGSSRPRRLQPCSGTGAGPEAHSSTRVRKKKAKSNHLPALPFQRLKSGGNAEEIEDLGFKLLVGSRCLQPTPCIV